MHPFTPPINAKYSRDLEAITMSACERRSHVSASRNPPRLSDTRSKESLSGTRSKESLLGTRHNSHIVDVC